MFVVRLVLAREGRRGGGEREGKGESTKGGGREGEGGEEEGGGKAKGEGEGGRGRRQREEGEKAKGGGVKGKEEGGRGRRRGKGIEGKGGGGGGKGSSMRIVHLTTLCQLTVFKMFAFTLLKFFSQMVASCGWSYVPGNSWEGRSSFLD